MRYLRFWIAFGMLAAFAGNAAVIYKWTDADGVVHFSDQPVPGAERLEVGPAPRVGTFGEKPPPTPGRTTEKATPTKPADYTQFVLSSPTPEQVFFNDDPIVAHLNLDPGLLPNHSITWYLNGAPLTDQAIDAVTITMKQLARGTYTVAATVSDAVSGESRSSDPVTFYVREPSALSPQHK
jgi:hypothetical protein